MKRMLTGTRDTLTCLNAALFLRVFCFVGWLWTDCVCGCFEAGSELLCCENKISFWLGSCFSKFSPLW